MKVTKGKVLSLFIAVGYVVALIVRGFGISDITLKICAALLLPLALIWFPKEIGNYTGNLGASNYIDSVTPAILISFMGWFFLVGFPIIIYLAYKYG